MSHFIIHVGPEKTGTTAIQKALADNYQRLKNKGILYPRLWRGWLWGHHQLLRQIRTAEPEARELRSSFDRLRATGLTVLFSSESFATYKPAHISRLAELIGDAEVVVYIYIRRWDKLIASVWQERIKYGAHWTLPRFYADMLSYPLDQPTLNYAIIADRFANAFGEENIRFIVYDNIEKKSADIVEHFFQEVLKDADIVSTGERINEGLNPFEIEIIRLLNRIEYGKERVISIEMRRRFMKGRDRCEDQVKRLSDIMRPHLDKVSIAGDNTGFEIMEKRFLAKYGPNIMNKADEHHIFLETGHTDVEYVDSTYAIEPEVSELIQRIHQAVTD